MQIVRKLTTHKPLPCAATIGFFDGVHSGHRFLIEQVKREAAAHGLQSAIITFASHPRRIVQPDFKMEMLTTQEEKLALLEATGIELCYVLDFTPEMAKLTAQEFMLYVLKQHCGVERLVIGYDHRFGHNRTEDFYDYTRYGESMAMQVMQAQGYIYNGMTISSSLIRRYLRCSDVRNADICLSYDYFLNGTVVSGYQVGRKMGFPTANLQVNSADKLIPADGVYAVRVTLQDGSAHNGMLNIGTRPTFCNDATRTIEVHILRFNSNLYNQPIRISFVAHIRAEMKFTDVKQLIKQLQSDAVRAEELLTRYSVAE